LVNENIYKIISLVNEIEIPNFSFVCWMQNKIKIMNIYIFPFSPSMSNKPMIYGHTLCFLSQNYNDSSFHKIK